MLELAVKADLAVRNSRITRWLKRDDRGMATAEYAVGTVAVIGLGGILYKILTDEVIREAIVKVILRVISLVLLGQ